MNRTPIAILAGIALAAISLVPSDPAGAAPSGTRGRPKTVERSTTGSYVVVMEAPPLAASMAPAKFRLPQGQAAAAQLARSHVDVLQAVGASAGDKVQDFTHALNGFSAILSHEQAVALAGTAGVKLVVPDEVRQLHTDSSGKFLGLTGTGAAWASGVTGDGVVVGSSTPASGPSIRASPTTAAMRRRPSCRWTAACFPPATSATSRTASTTCRSPATTS